MDQKVNQRTMKIKRKKIDNSGERNLLTGLIVSGAFINSIIPVLDLNLLKSPWSRTVASWCIQYYKKYKEAPGKTIQDIFLAEEENVENADLISSFLENLSENYEGSFNYKYAYENAEKFLKIKRVEKLKADIINALTNDDVSKAEQVIGNFKKIEKPLAFGVDILDEQTIINAQNEDEEVLFRLPGAVGQLLGNFCREDFVCISAPMKRGKTFWLMYFAVKAMLSNLKVLYLNSEMKESKMIKRLYRNFLGEVDKSKIILVPYFDANEIKYKKVQKNGMTIKKMIKKAKAIKKMFKAGGFRLMSFPTNSLNSQIIKTHLDNLENYEGFIPDVIIDDYMDIHAPEPFSPREVRHQIDFSWKAARGLAQERKCLYISATQGSRATFSRDQQQEDITEDIRKLAHVTMMIALNQTKEEKKNQVMRVGVLAERDDEFHVEDEVVILQQFAMSKAIIDSRWSKDVIYDE